MNKLITLVFFQLLSASVFAQIDTTILVSKTQEYINHYINNDFDLMADMNHPNIISLGGGTELVSKDLSEDKKTLEGFGIKFINGKPGLPGNVIDNNNELLCFIPQIYRVELGGKQYDSTSFLLASSSTKGENWSFVSLDRFDAKSIGQFIPNYSDELTWPEVEPMVPVSIEEK